MQNQNMIHSAVQENEFDCRPYCMRGKNQVNYAKYGSYYVEMLKNLDQSRPRFRTLLLKKE